MLQTRLCKSVCLWVSWPAAHLSLGRGMMFHSTTIPAAGELEKLIKKADESFLDEKLHFVE